MASSWFLWNELVWGMRFSWGSDSRILQILADRRYAGCHYCECEMCWEDTVVYKIFALVTSHRDIYYSCLVSDL